MLTKETFEKYLKEDPNGFVIMHHIKEEDMLAAFRHPGTWIGSDGMPFTDASGKPLPLDAAYGEGNGHPRGAGAYAKALRMVREQSVVPLMEALAKMSYYQAKWLEDMVPDLRYRGRLQPGAVADITIFDPETVRDNAEFNAGKQSLPSTGIPYVIVNGTVVVKDSKVLKDVYPGQPIRNAVLD
jgi:N-acyl-D-aspartate/D-glutamate deacylase